MRKLLIALLALCPLLTIAQTSILKIDGVTKETTGAELVNSFGRPTKIDTSSYGITYTYDIGCPSDYETGWVIFYGNKDGTLKSVSIKGSKRNRCNDEVLNKIKAKFGLSADIVGLFSKDFKGVESGLKKEGTTFGKPQKTGSKYGWYIEYTGSGPGNPKITIGDGKTYEDDRQGKLYMLDFSF